MKNKTLILLVCAGFAFLGWRFVVNKEQNGLPPSNEKVSQCVEEMKVADDTSPLGSFNGISKPVDFSSFSKARTFYTRITETVSSGPNFAKHFTLAYWGCGTDCYGYAVVDANTGGIIAYSPANGEYHLRNGYSLDNAYFVLDPVHAGQERKFYKITKGDDSKYQLEIACTETSKEEMYGSPE